MTGAGGVRPEELLLRVTELPEAERARFLDAACAGDDALRRKVERMLAQRTAAEAFLETPAVLDLDDTGEATPGPADSEGSLVGKRLGRYDVVRLIGEGGMGVVYEARQESPHRAVALKVMRPGWGSRRLARRFKQESEVLGRLTHPGIARIYEAGSVTIGGVEQPFFVMELVEGVPISRHAAALGVRARLELMACVCDAVQHAHQKGVIHRDLKPGNVLVDSSGQPKILDFGVARATQGDSAATMQTEAGLLVGTLAYMSPEQAAGRSADVDTRADIYSLGAMLFELMTGRLPHALAGRPLPEAVRTIAEDEPVRAGSVNRSLRGDIETIIGKALQKDRERRYASAAGLAADLRRFLNHQPITARPAGTLYQLRKFAARNKGLVAGVVAAFIALAAGLGVATWQAVRATREARLNERLTYRLAIRLADSEISADHLPNARDLLSNAPAPLRGWEWSYLWTKAGGDETVLTAASEVHALAASSDGAWLAAGLASGQILVWDRSGTEPARLGEPQGASNGISALAFSPDGVLLASGHREGNLVLWNLTTMRGQAIGSGPAGPEQPGEPGPVRLNRDTAIAFAPDGATIASAGRAEDGVVVWDARAPSAPVRTLRPGGQARLLAYLRDGRLLILSVVSAGSRRTADEATVSLWDAGGHVVFSVPIAVPIPRDVRGLAAMRRPGSESETAVVAVSDGSVIVIDCAPPHAPTVLARPEPKLMSMAVDAAGTMILVGEDRAVVLDAQTGKELKRFSGHANKVACATFVGGLPLVATGSLDQTVRIERLGDQDARAQLEGGETWCVASPAPGRYVVGALDAHIKAWAWRDTRATLRWEGSRVEALAMGPTGTWAVLGSKEGAVTLLSVESGETLATFDMSEGVIQAAVSRDGATVAGATESGLVRVWDVPTREIVAEHRGRYGCPTLEFSPDGRYLLAGSRDGELMRLPLANRARAMLVTHYDAQIDCIAFNSSGDTVAIGLDTADPGAVRLFGTGDWQPRGRLGVTGAQPWRLAFTPDGKRVAVSEHFSKLVRVYALNDAQPLITIRLPQSLRNPAAPTFSADGTLVVVTRDGTLLTYGRIPAAPDTAWPIR